jgi:RNA polymerase sigma-70 factor (ECF subfamily)
MLLTTPTDAKPEPADIALMRRMSDGDETALAALYDRYAGLVFSVAKRILGDRGAAEEILQDIFYRAWRMASSFDSSRGSLAAWLLVSARNRAIDQLRRARGFKSDPMREEDITLNFRLDSQVTRNVMLSKVKKAVENLPESQRHALELAFFEGLTHSEIAERTGEPLGTIKTRLRTALGSLKKVLQP